MKKIKYIVYSFILVLLLWFLPSTRGLYKALLVGAIFISTVVGALVTQWPVKLKDVFSMVLLPVHLAAGAVLSLYFFPNLGPLTRAIAVFGVGGLLYAVCLVTNIFMVVDERERRIPLYRVAITWSQIIIVAVAILYFSGVYKLPINTFFQNLFVGASSFLFVLYLFWALAFDNETAKIGRRDQLLFAFGAGFSLAALGVSVSFFPTESFLRALFASSLLMSALGFLYSHAKNIITKSVVAEYFMISLVFLILLFVFNP